MLTVFPASGGLQVHPWIHRLGSDWQLHEGFYFCFYQIGLVFFSNVFRVFPHLFGQLSKSSWSIWVVLVTLVVEIEEMATLMATVKRLKVILDNSATKDRDQALLSSVAMDCYGMDGVIPEKSNFENEFCKLVP